MYKDHWGKEEVIIPITGPTWIEMYMAANEAIRRSGDKHHVFIERFEQSTTDPRYVFLTTGS